MREQREFFFVADLVLRARRIACVSVANIELFFGTYADSVQFPSLAAASTLISLLEQSIYIYMYFHPFYYLSMTSSNLFW